MKKFYSILLLITVLGFSLAGCNSPTDNDLEKRVEILESQVAEMEQILIDIEVIKGLNGQNKYYLPEDDSSIFTAVSAEEFEVNPNIDTSIAPSYAIDNGEYVEFKTVMNRLVGKYFDNATVPKAMLGSKIEVSINYTDYTKEELMARTIMMINELVNYDWYIIGGSEIYFVFYGPMDTCYIKLLNQTLRSTFITITPEVIMEGAYEVQLYKFITDKEEVQRLYDKLLIDEQYQGYVLNYTE